ncbi:YggS family pyridoxal phosphate-dependent enzyme [Metabacillus sp. RGM 3146]|uniref:YggS family pyridoxal phosphate-dependent enzyme n=1 Tax=Metabacillus sp. RGM 3146 TaxID=3401092 RepID=UPI003B995D7D
MNVAENLEIIKNRINEACKRANRNSKEVTIIAVTKYVSVDKAVEALEAGAFHLGENRDEGLTHKFDCIGNKAVWHFIGSLQSRKVKNVIDKITYIHSLDRLSLASEIDKRSVKPVKCFVQVNVSGEESKHGIEPEKVIPFVKELTGFTNIQVIGLMTMAPNTDDASVIRSCFKRLKSLQKEIKDLNLARIPCSELSMGMSNDYEIAIEEGATFIRIGSSLVGNETGGV